MEIGRHAEDVGDAPSSIQLLKMPWNNNPPSRQASQDPRPPSRDSMHSGGGGFRSSVSRGFQDDADFGFSTPIRPRREEAGLSQGVSTRNALTVVFDSQRELLEKESREFCEYKHSLTGLMIGSCNSHLRMMMLRVLLFKNVFLLKEQVDLCLRMLFIILVVRFVGEWYLTIVLATRGVLVVAQTEPYGDISLKMAT